jgi:hypothetical protein
MFDFSGKEKLIQYFWLIMFGGAASMPIRYRLCQDIDRSQLEYSTI